MKIFKVILILSFVLIPCLALADMTDQQILKYVSEQTSKGTSQAEMLQYLMKQGVSPQRLQMLKEKYKNTGAKGKDISKSTGVNRSRTAAVENKGMTTGRLMGTSAKGGKFDEQSSDYLSMQEALTGLVPDSTGFEIKELQKGPLVFGRDIFRNEMISFEPNMNIATPASYVLGAGDQIFIDIYGASQISVDGIISPDGFIVVEEYGPLQLAGLTVEEANRRARQKLGSIYADSKIKLTVGQTRSIQVNVVGEVLVPGSYTLPGFASVFHALYSAGGVSEIGSLRTVKHYRNNKLQNTIDVYDYILNGQLSGDIRLQDNDVLVVGPYEALVNVAGKAKRPMYYEMKPTESIGKALEYAGGFAADAYKKTMRVVRKAGGNMQVFNIDASNMNDFLVADGDSMFIDSVMIRYENMVELQGAVFHPGMYQLGGQVSSVKSLLQYADGATESAFLKHGVIRRRRANRTQEVLQVDLEAILNGSAADVKLQNEDVLFVPSLQDVQDNQTMTIRGEVFEPGIYEFAYNTTVEDLVLMAGGLKETASLNKVSVARREKNGGVKTYTMDLKPGLAIDGKNSFVLEPYDEVMVKRSEGYREQQVVSIEGEVNFQGEFSLPKENTRISELLEMAGGLTSLAAQNGVYVLRQMDEEEIRIRRNRLDDSRFNNVNNTIIRSTQMQGITTLPISDSLLVERDMREDFYKVAVDLRKIMKNPGCEEDLILRDGDHVMVERQKNTVMLSGNMPYRGAVPYVQGKSLKFYLRQGGVRPSRRNLKMSYVVGPNGQAMVYRQCKKIEPGSDIYLREVTTELTTAQKVSIFASVASTFATAAAVVISVIK